MFYEGVYKTNQNLIITFFVFLSISPLDILFNFPIFSSIASILALLHILNTNSIKLILFFIGIIFFTFIYSYSLLNVDPLYTIKSSFSYGLLLICPFLRPVLITSRIQRYSLLGSDILVIISMLSLILSTHISLLPGFYIEIIKNPIILLTKDFYDAIGNNINLLAQAARGIYFIEIDKKGFITGIFLCTFLVNPFLLGIELKKIGLLRKILYFIPLSITFSRSLLFSLILRPFYKFFNNINLIIFGLFVYLFFYETLTNRFVTLSRGRSEIFSNLNLSLLRPYGFGFYKDYISNVDSSAQGSFHSIFTEYIYSLGIFGIISTLTFLYFLYISLKRKKNQGKKYFNLTLFSTIYFLVLLSSSFNTADFSLIYSAVIILNLDFRNLVVSQEQI